MSNSDRNPGARSGSINSLPTLFRVAHTEWLALPRCGTADIQLGDKRLYWVDGEKHIEVTVLWYDETEISLAHESYADAGIIYPGCVFNTDYSNLGETVAEYEKIKEMWSLNEPC